MQQQPAWFESWFDSPYYHLLYQKRDYSEAAFFIDRLLNHLQPPPRATMLDLACGKGRHSLHLANRGFDVTGIDLSVGNITYAQQWQRDGLAFYSHDMRLPFRTRYFDYIFNFFTSFGYFDTERDHLNALKNAAKGLRTQGIFVLDFFNIHYLAQTLVPLSEETAGGITFRIVRYIADYKVQKEIRFTDDGRDYEYRESVQAFGLQDFERLFQAAGLAIYATFGDYQLQPYVPHTSPRLILFAHRIA